MYQCEDDLRCFVFCMVSEEGINSRGGSRVSKNYYSSMLDCEGKVRIAYRYTYIVH